MKRSAVLCSILGSSVLASCTNVENVNPPVTPPSPSKAPNPEPPKLAPDTFDMGTPAVKVKDSLANKVLIVVNDNSPYSNKIGKYYAEARGIPAENILHINTVSSENVANEEYFKNIAKPVEDRLAQLKHIEYIVTTKGVPLRLIDGKHCVDSLLGGIGNGPTPIRPYVRHPLWRPDNPYFRQDEHFTHAKYNFYLACRLDAYDLKDIKALIDNSVAAKPEKGLFFCDSNNSYQGGGFGSELGKEMEDIAKDLTKKGFQALTDATPEFVAPQEAMMGYWSAGSNDPKFRMEAYHALKFKPGSIGETDVSSSGRTFYPTVDGQSLIADLIHQGLTGGKGYVDEPFTPAIAKPYVMFDRYTKGYNLAESFYMASMYVQWKDVVIGDPLCRPYAKNRS